ncbi:hypothetical protein EYR41_010188 [Orbilia oligospora]|uniref:Uncharacterized protein n=1 Tax=Orbilia oligospora TaxID=2813651 RepID=A0A8H2HM67_ORBOL|nr:hypothetical protein EYR41_010188 [Orbilia oligospora]
MHEYLAPHAANRLVGARSTINPALVFRLHGLRFPICEFQLRANMPKLRTQDNGQRTNAEHEISIKGFNVFNGCFFGSQESNTCTTELRQGPSTPQFVIVQCVAAKVSMRSRKIIYRKIMDDSSWREKTVMHNPKPYRVVRIDKGIDPSATGYDRHTNHFDLDDLL